MKRIDRFCYRCSDCLMVMFADVHLTTKVGAPVGTCEGCGGGIEYMGRVRVDGSRLFERVEVCACDAKCTCARGPACSCPCGGVNHGTGATVEVLVDKGAVPRFQPRDVAKQQARATEYRAALEAARARVRARYGALVDDYKSGTYIACRATWDGIRHELGAIGRARALRSHGGRVKALAEVCPDRGTAAA